ncbi:MAG: hypothetical protein KatS3mg010_0330 [Acidimicrobiia bacterium]|nr:MAG: hypothetical protein KatS3mg010_0330 [Acidimicrobiia bacterium]
MARRPVARAFAWVGIGVALAVGVRYVPRVVTESEGRTPTTA